MRTVDQRWRGKPVHRPIVRRQEPGPPGEVALQWTTDCGPSWQGRFPQTPTKNLRIGPSTPGKATAACGASPIVIKPCSMRAASTGCLVEKCFEKDGAGMPTPIANRRVVRAAGPSPSNKGQLQRLIAPQSLTLSREHGSSEAEHHLVEPADRNDRERRTLGVTIQRQDNRRIRRRHREWHESRQGPSSPRAGRCRIIVSAG